MESLMAQMEQHIFGQTRQVRFLMTAMLAGGHVLLEGVPGLGKTKMVRTLAALLGGDYRRIQFTPDLMPSDITGSVVFNMKDNDFYTVKGPIFTQLLLADEINRTPPKTQAALLEAMEEGQVTIQGETYPLPQPFFVAATQNPVEYEGTYPLPEAQLDRFFMKLVLDYPDEAGEKQILKHHEGSALPESGEFTLEQLIQKQKELDSVTVDEAMMNYITAVIRKTRELPEVQLGASPRAGIALLTASKAWALLSDRMYVTPDDVKLVAKPVLRHRLLVTPQAELEGVTSDRFIEETLSSVPIPR